MNQSPDIGQIPGGGISDKSLINKNCHNSKTSNDIDMKFGPVARTDKRNTATSKGFDNDVMSASFNVTGQFGIIQKVDYESMVFNIYIFINSNFLSYKN